MHTQMTGKQNIGRFIFGGNATFTLVSAKTGTRFTYKVRASKDGRVHFVRVRSGREDWQWTYIGFVKNGKLVGGRKGRPDAASFKALAWYLGNVGSEQAEFWHAGKCARCARELTVPSSIQMGFGPDCAKVVGIGGVR